MIRNITVDGEEALAVDTAEELGRALLTGRYVLASDAVRAEYGLTDRLCQVNSPRGTIPGCTFDDPATFGIAFRLKSSATRSGCITDTA